jgi:spermidine/putrescine ABC transporter ATP-binding subunit
VAGQRAATRRSWLRQKVASREGAAGSTFEPGAVRLTGVSKCYGTVVALVDLDLTVLAGEFLALLGPSGSGKTTTMRIIGGFVTPDTGRIEIGGRDITNVEPFKRDVNTVFQSYALFPHMSVEGNVGYGLKAKRVPRNERKRRVTEALELVRLGESRGRRPNELSGGMQQRVALARALVNRPSVLLLDEPLGALDRKLREDMQVELRELQRSVGITFMYVTHDQEEALGMSDRLAVMRDGRIEQIGTPNEVYDNPVNLWVASFVGGSNRIPGVVRKVGELIELETDVALVHASCCHGSFQRGESAVVVVRPEHLEVSRANDPSGANRVRVFVQEILNVGDQIKCFATTAGGLRLCTCIHRSIAAFQDIRPGDELWLSWQPEAAHVYPKDAPRADAEQSGDV